MAMVSQTLLRLGLLWLLLGSLSWAEGATKLIEQVSDSGQITACSPDASISSSLITAAEQLQEQMRTLYGVDPAPNTHLIIRAESWDYRVSDELPSILLWRMGPQVIFQLTFHQRPRAGLVQLFRSLVEVTLYQSIYKDGQMMQGGKLLDLPLWLNEGILQGLLEGRSELNSTIIRRAHRLEKAPALETIMSWQRLSEDPVQRAWQQAFCWVACQFIFQQKDRSDGLTAWLDDRARNKVGALASWRLDEKQALPWKQFQVEVGHRNEPIFYDWDQSLSALKDSLVFQLPMNPKNPDKEPAADLTFDTLYKNRTRYGFTIALTNKISELAALETRVHFSLRRVLQDYLAALGPLQIPTDLMQEYGRTVHQIQESSPADKLADANSSSKPNPDSKNNHLAHELKDLDDQIRQVKPQITEAEYQSRLSEAGRKLNELLNYKKGVDDYLNWFEVTQRTPMMHSSFEEYFQLSDKLDGIINRTHSASSDELIEIEKKL